MLRRYCRPCHRLRVNMPHLLAHLYFSPFFPPITLATSPENCNCVANISRFLYFFCRQLLCSLPGRQILQDKLRTSLHNGHLKLIRKAQSIQNKTHFSSANTLAVFFFSYFLFVVPSVCLRRSQALTQLYKRPLTNLTFVKEENWG